MTPSLASRPAFFEAVAAPFLRRIVSAAVRSPLASTSAFLQSIMPALVFSRSCLTFSGETLLSPGDAGAGVVMEVVVDISGNNKCDGHRPPPQDETRRKRR